MVALGVTLSSSEIGSEPRWWAMLIPSSSSQFLPADEREVVEDMISVLESPVLDLDRDKVDSASDDGRDENVDERDIDFLCPRDWTTGDDCEL